MTSSLSVGFPSRHRQVFSVLLGCTMSNGSSASSSSAPHGVLLGMGNPLLDISAVVKPEMLKKYNLKDNDAILYEKEDIYEELVREYEVDYIAGGATQNSTRVAQWILGTPNSAAYFGCVGTDSSAERLEKVAKKDGLEVKYQKTGDHPTGKCAVLITGHHRWAGCCTLQPLLETII